MKLIKFCGSLFLLIFPLILFACGSGGGSGGGSGSDTFDSGGGETGTVSVGLTDNSTDIFDAVYVTIKELHFNKKDGLSDRDDRNWKVFSTPNKTYNLLKLVNGVTEVLGNDDLGAGHYKQVRLVIGKTPESENNIKGEEHPYANYVIKDGVDIPLKIPSGLQTGIKLVHHFKVEPNSYTELLLDFDACRSVVKSGNSGKYVLKPTIKVIDTLNKSLVSGTVTYDPDPPQPIQAIVSAQISDGLSATVARSTLTDINGDYAMYLSPNQTYKAVAFSSEIITGSNPVDDRMYSPACANVDTPTVDIDIDPIVLAESKFGTISGEVNISGEIVADETVVNISFYTNLKCMPENVDSYVEIKTESIHPDSNTVTYNVQLPLGVYDVVASSECFVPATAFGIPIDEVDHKELVPAPELTITELGSCY